MHKALIFACLVLLAVVSARDNSQLLNIKSKNIGETPITDYFLHLVDIHWLSNDLNQQYVAHHFCAFPYDGFMICELFNGGDKKSRPIGIEYFVTEKVFKKLPDDEKKYWHSHPYEILSGLFVVMGVTPEEEQIVLDYLMGTYGKVVDTWQYYNDMPIGPPQLGYALALDSQVDWDLADRMDKDLNVGTTHKERRAARQDMKKPERADGADAYLFKKQAPQFIDEMREMPEVETIKRSGIKDVIGKVVGKVERLREEL